MTGPQILVVEDNERNMKLFRDVLQASGYRTLEATTGERAVELALEHRPDLVLMDIQLPDIDGVEALDRLRADERSASDAGARPDRAGDGRRPRALPGRRLRRLPLQARGHRGVRGHREALLRGSRSMSDDAAQDPRGRRRSRERAPARGRARGSGLRRRLGHRRPGCARARRIGEAGPRAARRDDAAARRPRRLQAASRARGDGGAAGDHAHGERGVREDDGDRGRRGRLHPEAVQPRRAAHPHPVAAPDQALPRHDQGSGRRAARSEPDARRARADAARGARPTAAATTVPLAPARGRDRLLGRRVDPAQPPPAGRDVLRRPARLDELRRCRRARGADARARQSSTARSAVSSPGSTRRSASSRATASSSSSTIRSRCPIPRCGRFAWAVRSGKRWSS